MVTELECFVDDVQGSMMFHAANFFASDHGSWEVRITWVRFKWILLAMAMVYSFSSRQLTQGSHASRDMELIGFRSVGGMSISRLP